MNIVNNIADMMAFVSAVEMGSFTLASKNLGISRSAVGKRIAKLESELNTRLLQRSTRSLALTEEGQIFYERCLKVLQDLNDAKRILLERREKPSGRLRISVPASLGQHFVASIIHRYLSEYPDISIELIMVDRYVDLINEKVDVAIRIGIPNIKSELISRRIGTYKMITVASPVYVMKKGEPSAPNELHYHDLLAFVHTQSILPWQFQHNQQLETIFPQNNKAKCVVDNEKTLLYFARQGYGITQVAQFIAQPYLENGELVEVLNQFKPEGYPVFVIYPSRKQLSAKVRCFIDLIGEFE